MAVTNNKGTRLSKVLLWEILVLWTVTEGECKDRACPLRSLERITVTS